jgi:antitoxin ParD1/3/4
MHTISLPESLHAAVEHLAARGGFGSAADYIADLVRRDVEQNPPEPSPPLRQIVEEASGRTLTDAEWDRTTRRVESLLIEGLDSGPATEMTAEDWAQLHRRVEARLDRKEP